MSKLFGKKKKKVCSGKLDYSYYTMSVRQYLLWGSLGILSGSFLSIIFYRNWMILSAAGVVGMVVCPQIRKEYEIQKRKQQLSREFKEALYSLLVSLRAGRSLEGAFTGALEDLDPIMTPLIYTEWKELVKQLGVGFTIEDGLIDLGKRSGIEEIRSFGNMIAICKRSEGDVARIMENTIQLLQERMEIQSELRLVLIKKKTEQKILNLMPFIVVGLLLLMSPDYLLPLYNCLQGQIIMTVCMGLMIVSYLLSKKIADITL